MSLTDLYREVILDHFRTPRNKGHLDAPDRHAEVPVAARGEHSEWEGRDRPFTRSDLDPRHRNDVLAQFIRYLMRFFSITVFNQYSEFITTKAGEQAIAI